MRALITVLVLTFALGPADVWARQERVASDVEAKAVKEMAARIPAGSRVKAQTADGARIKGTLVTVTDEAVMIKKNTRLPEPAVTISFRDLVRLELQTGEGMSVGKVIGLGLAAGAGAILTLVTLMVALAD